MKLVNESLRDKLIGPTKEIIDDEIKSKFNQEDIDYTINLIKNLKTTKSKHDDDVYYSDNDNNLFFTLIPDHNYNFILMGDFFINMLHDKPDFTNTQIKIIIKYILQTYFNINNIRIVV